MDTRLYDLERLFEDSFNEITRNNQKVYSWNFIRIVLLSIIDKGEMEPFTVSYESSQRINDVYRNIYIVKAKNTSTKLFRVIFEAPTASGWNGIESLDKIEVHQISKIVYDVPSLIDYLNDRIARLNNQLDIKAMPFKNELSNLNLDIKDFVKMMQMFERLDAQTRSKLLKEGRTI